MSLYKNKDTGGAIRSAEQLPDGPAGELTVLYVAPDQADAVARALASRADTKVVTRMDQKGETILLSRTVVHDDALVEELSRKFNSPLTEIQRPDERPSKRSLLDMNRMRGLLGTVGQILQQVAGVLEKNPALNQASTISLTSNLITLGYGTPQRVDRKKTEDMRARADKLLAERIKGYTKPDEHEVTKDRYLGSPLEKANRFVGANNIVISDGMKFASQIFLANRGNNWVDQTMGALQASAKVVTFCGTDKDRDTPNKDKSWLQRLRENTNPISGTLEWAGQFMNLVNAVYLPQIHNVSFDQINGEFQKGGIKVVKKHYRQLGEVFSLSNWSNFRFQDVKIISPWRFAAVVLFLSGFAAKIFAPFSQRSVDWHEVHKHAGMALQQVPQEQRETLLLELTSTYLAAARDKRLTFGEVYQSLRNELNETPQKAPAAEAVLPAPSAQPTPSPTVQANSVIADRLRATSSLQHITFSNQRA